MVCRSAGWVLVVWGQTPDGTQTLWNRSSAALGDPALRDPALSDHALSDHALLRHKRRRITVHVKGVHVVAADSARRCPDKVALGGLWDLIVVLVSEENSAVVKLYFRRVAVSAC
ncbi:unnamed protein product [Boreogadus saida]